MLRGRTQRRARRRAVERSPKRLAVLGTLWEEARQRILPGPGVLRHENLKT
jgi:hypothetical protein